MRKRGSNTKGRQSPGSAVPVEAIAQHLRAPLLRMRLVWTAYWAPNFFYLFIGSAVARKAGMGPGQAQSLTLPALTALLSGLGGVSALISVPVFAFWRRRAKQRARNLAGYLSQMLAGEVIALGLCHNWAVFGLFLRLLGAGFGLQLLLTAASCLAYFLQYPFPARLLRDARELTARRPDFSPEVAG